MAAPVPGLPPDFNQRVMRELRHGSSVRSRYRRILLTGYGLVSAGTCMFVMRGQGLGWEAITLLNLGALALMATMVRRHRAIPLTQRPGSV